MRANLDPARVPLIHAQTVAKQNDGVIGLVDQFIVPNAGQLQGADRARLDAAVANLQGRNEAAGVAGQDPGAEREGRFPHRREAVRPEAAVRADVPLSRAEIKQRAEAEMSRVREEMYGIARQVLQGRAAPPTPERPSEEQKQKAIEAALDLAYADRPARDQVVDAAKAALAKATDRAFARPGRRARRSGEGDPDARVPARRRGRVLRFARPAGQGPGHLLRDFADPRRLDQGADRFVPARIQLAHDRFSRSTRRCLVTTWKARIRRASCPRCARCCARACSPRAGRSTERMMADAGFDGDDPLFKLVQRKFYLRTIANSLLDQGVHVDGWSREQAMRLMTRDAFQQEREATGKWVRARSCPAQLPTYFVGVQEQFDTRKAVQAKLGDKFDLKAYHDQVLSIMRPPVRFVREAMLDEPIR